jgi:hypothetical protein
MVQANIPFLALQSLNTSNTTGGNVQIGVSNVSGDMTIVDTTTGDSLLSLYMVSSGIAQGKTRAQFGLQVGHSGNLTYQTAGTLILANGSAQVNTAAVRTSSLVMLSRQTIGANAGLLSYTIANAVSFNVASTSVNDSGSIAYFIVDAQ